MSEPKAATINTPNIDALVKTGVQLTEADVSRPVCSLSRAALLTGHYPQGWEYNPAGRDRDRGMSADAGIYGETVQRIF